ncbi:MAG: sensor histidine kinase [Lachnospiraceae bacterium]|jgi:two-component system sensor histidine kinase YesM|nr:sensor histidine kinase [Lachnospiraceae bacterium]MCI9681754.1 sensor histidine kinase [Lachnospiraceae bacterium]
MKNLQELLFTKNLRRSFLVFTFTAVLSVTLVLTMTGSRIYIDSIEEHAYASTAEMQNQVQKSVDLKLEDIEKTLKLLGESRAVQGYLVVDEDREQGKRVELETEVRNLLLEYSAVHRDYLNIVLASSLGHYLSNDSYRIQKQDLSEEKWYQDAVRAEGRPVVISTSIGRNLQDWRNYSSDSYVSVAQAIYGTKSRELIGVALIDLDKRSIQSLVGDITLGQTGFVFIMDSKGNILYTPENKVVYRINPAWFLEAQSGSFKCRIQEDQYRIIYNQSEYTRLTTVGLYDMGKTIEGVSRVQRVSVLLAVLCCGVALVWSALFSKTITTPISNLSRLMKRAQTGDLTVRFDNHYQGEIGQLGDAFNAMVDKINELLRLVYAEQKQKREAEMKILREQIKPHFLYNTLDSIQWMAKRYQAKDIVETVRALSNFFRICLSSGKEYITLREEMSLVRSYLDVQKFRYEDLFEYEPFCPEELLGCEVPRLIIQPLVENALYHGIKESDQERGNIRIRIEKEEPDILLILVMDDGAGMSAKECGRLNKILRMEERPEEIRAFGVRNVHDRIRFSYGEAYGLFYRPGTGGGTIAEIRLPLKGRRDRNTEEKDDVENRDCG